MHNYLVYCTILFINLHTQHALRFLVFGQTWKVLGLQDDKVDEEDDLVEEATKRKTDDKEGEAPDAKKIKVEI